MRVADYIWQRLYELGVRHCFCVVGGGAMHLNDALIDSKIKTTFMHHEQACAMAAEGYARVAGIPAAVCVTTGPGGINALNGVFGAWCDSIPMIVVSGQVKNSLSAFGLGVRQLGPQENEPILVQAKSMTKDTWRIRHAEAAARMIDAAYEDATTGRPGPVWLDVPLDVQGAEIGNPVSPKPTPPPKNPPPVFEDFNSGIDQGQDLFRAVAKRPVILAGSGIRQAGAVDLFRSVVERLGIPVVLSRSALDLLPYDSPVYCGRSGVDCSRAANFVIQNADYVLSIGCRLSSAQVGYDWSQFAPNAVKDVVDIDEAELNKPTVKANMKVCMDAGEFLSRLCWVRPVDPAWLAWCKAMLAKYPAVTDKMRSAGGPLNPYHFLETLYAQLADDDVVVLANGSATVMGAAVAKPKANQRWWFNSGCGSMGYALPAAIGAAIARGGKRVICIEGDGSLAMCSNSLQTVKDYGLNIKIYVIENGGYLSIRQTQDGYFGRRIGESPKTGVGLPDFDKLGKAYGVDLTVCHVDPSQSFEPRMQSRMEGGKLVSPPIHDMYPFLSREEVAENMRGPK